MAIEDARVDARPRRRWAGLRPDGGATIWLTGLSGAGKSTLAGVLATELRAGGHNVEVLDGDAIRENLSRGLGFSREDRDTNIRRIGFVADLLTRNGVIVIVSAISPYREVRDEVRARIADFMEVHVHCTLQELIRRDVKGLYSRALAGEITHFTGVSDPYEEPLEPDVRVDSSTQTIEESARAIMDALLGLVVRGGRVGSGPDRTPPSAQRVPFCANCSTSNTARRICFRRRQSNFIVAQQISRT